MLETVGAVLGLTILLLAVPVNLVYALRKDDSWRGRAIVYWMFGLVRVRLRRGKAEPARKAKRRRRRRRAFVAGARGAVRRRRDLLAVLRTPGLLRGMLRLLRELLRAMRPRRMRVEFVIGMDDPADTGRLAGVLAPLRLMFGKRTLGKSSNVSIEVTPDFSGPRLQGYSCASVQFVPLKLIALVVGFMFSAPVFRAAKTMMRRSRARSP